jgi:hypothetical protein
MLDDFSPADFKRPEEFDPISDAKGRWLRARCGKLTSSNVSKARSFKKGTKGARGEPTQERIRLIQEIIAERMTEHSVRHFVTDAMQWGIDHEDDARAVYEARQGVLVNHLPYQFRDHPTIELCGASHDGLVGDDGMIEIKCPTTAKYVGWRKERVVPEEHRDQIILELACWQRKWCDFVAYDPRVKDPKLRLLVVRFEPEPKDVEAVEEDVRQFLTEVEDWFLAVTHG